MTEQAITISAGGSIPADTSYRALTNINKNVGRVLSAAKSAGTVRAYGVQLCGFAAFRGLAPARPERRDYASKEEYTAARADYLTACIETTAGATINDIVSYISSLASGDSSRSVSTIDQFLAALHRYYKITGLQDLTSCAAVRDVRTGARRMVGVAPVKKIAATGAIVEQLVSALDRSTLTGKRDAALLLLGFCGAFRRSELAALDVEDLELTADDAGRPAYVVTVRRSKTDQQGRGLKKGIFTARSADMCPVRAIQDYMSAAGITSGALFRRIERGGKISTRDNCRLSGQAVALIIKRSAAAAGVSPENIKRYSGHSLRSGFVTTAMDKGQTDESIMNQTGHKSIVVMYGYRQRDNALRHNAAAAVMASL